ncbi:MAG: prepilin-type N-terminal cleavage/methylation domain-containing protein [Candidatus Omnitrophica bacterium]|nr:prepilin-type N-terminal cleavage/methylation domain-containing protein [Candidatus Omnitrophota bacterium]
MKNKKQYIQGFTLMELMVVTVILIVAIGGILATYIQCLAISEISRNSTTAMIAAKSRLEDIKNASFDQLVTKFNKVSFSIGDLNGIGVSYVDNTNLDLYKITISVCWQQRNGQIIGEDTNLNGQLDAGEDVNHNNIIDSPLQIVTYIYNR